VRWIPNSPAISAVYSVHLGIRSTLNKAWVSWRCVAAAGGTPAGHGRRAPGGVEHQRRWRDGVPIKGPRLMGWASGRCGHPRRQVCGGAGGFGHPAARCLADTGRCNGWWVRRELQMPEDLSDHLWGPIPWSDTPVFAPLYVVDGRPGVLVECPWYEECHNAHGDTDTLCNAQVRQLCARMHTLHR
jgi:hypothetical protein